MKRMNLVTIGVMSITVLSGGVTALATSVIQGITENEVEFIAGDDEEIDVELPEKEPEVEIDPIDPDVKGPFTLFMCQSVLILVHKQSAQNMGQRRCLQRWNVCLMVQEPFHMFLLLKYWTLVGSIMAGH